MKPSKVVSMRILHRQVSLECVQFAAMGPPLWGRIRPPMIDTRPHPQNGESGNLEMVWALTVPTILEMDG